MSTLSDVTPQSGTSMPSCTGLTPDVLPEVVGSNAENRDKEAPIIDSRYGVFLFKIRKALKTPCNKRNIPIKEEGLELIYASKGKQFVVPAYLRNYTQSSIRTYNIKEEKEYHSLK